MNILRSRSLETITLLTEKIIYNLKIRKYSIMHSKKKCKSKKKKKCKLHQTPMENDNT